MRTSTGIIFTAVAGFAAGVVTGLLVAPQSGEELRGQIASRAQDQLRRAEARLRQVEEQLHALDNQFQETRGQVKERMANRVAEVRSKAEDLVSPTSELEQNWDVEEGEVARDLRHMTRK